MILLTHIIILKDTMMLINKIKNIVIKTLIIKKVIDFRIEREIVITIEKTIEIIGLII